ncbi:MAG: hypothetical protein EOO20_19740 [Chryseobacterium sp.]|nr:MAG: hypothetical protein EOO20_19740 [Chryseobacterium sp.]
MKMKIQHQYISLLILFVISGLACKKMDETYKQYVVTGGITYAGKVTAPLVYAGKNRIKIAWLRGADPNVTSAKIYWNNFQDSTRITIPSTGDTISVIIPNLQERQYTFVAKTFDAKGNTSIPVELLGESFGSKYEALLVARPVSSYEFDANGKLTIEWGLANVSGGAYATEVQYTDATNLIKTKRFLVAETSSSIADYKPGTQIQIRTIYVPNQRSIDNFYTPYVTYNVSGKINKSTWTATSDSFATTSQLPNGPPAKAIDDNITTFWHTETTATRVFPHWLAVDMKKLISVSRVELTCRQDNFTTFTSFTLQGSNDGVTWTDAETFPFVMKNPTQSYMLTNVLKTRYIRIYATTGPNYYANLAEFSVFGYE